MYETFSPYGAILSVKVLVNEESGEAKFQMFKRRLSADFCSYRSTHNICFFNPDAVMYLSHPSGRVLCTCTEHGSS